MANQGKRMVKENLIAEISQKQDELSAGTGISITGSTISVNTETVAMVSSLATVATTGAYSDLTGTPTITVVSANTGATPSATLTDLDIDGTVYEVPQGGSGGSSDTAFIKLDYDKCVITGPSALDQTTITAWIKTLPIFVSNNDNDTTGENSVKNYLVTNYGFSADNIYTPKYPGSMGYELTGYFALLKETTSSPIVPTEFIIFTPEGRTGTNSLVNRTNRSATRLFNVNNSRWKIVDAQYKGTNTSLSAYTDPLGVNITVYAKSSSVDRVIDIETKDTTVNPIKNQFVAFGFSSPTGSENPFVAIPDTDGVYLATKANNKLTFTQFAAAPTVDGTYDLEATVSDGAVTYTWVART